MFHALQTSIRAATMERLTLLVNHVLQAEPVATRRLLVHAGRTVRIAFDGWPELLPPMPAVVFRITPAGLLEWEGDEASVDADLRVGIDSSNPALAMAQALVGTRPRVEVSGDAALAADVNWLFDNLRWDVQDDLAAIIGPVPAREVGRLAAGIAASFKAAARTLGGLAARARPGAGSAL